MNITIQFIESAYSEEKADKALGIAKRMIAKSEKRKTEVFDDYAFTATNKKGGVVVKCWGK